METRHPDIEVQLSGRDGNALAVIGEVRNALRGGGVSIEEVSDFVNEAMSGDYDHVLATCAAWVDIR